MHVTKPHALHKTSLVQNHTLKLTGESWADDINSCIKVKVVWSTALLSTMDHDTLGSKCFQKGDHLGALEHFDEVGLF
jgi:hypothetical protein